MAKMSMKAYEKTAMNMKMDKAKAKKAGMSAKAYEGSKADMKADKAEMKAMMKGKKKK